MIQMRWRKAGATETWAFKTIDGEAVVLQYRLHFVPVLITDRVPAYSLKTAREVDAEWKDVTIQLPAS